MSRKGMLHPSRRTVRSAVIWAFVAFSGAAAFGATIAGITPSRICPGDGFTINGTFAAAPGQVSIRQGRTVVVPDRRLGVRWGRSRIQATLRATETLAPGTYRVVVTDTAGTDRRGLEVTTCGGPPPPPPPALQITGYRSIRGSLSACAGEKLTLLGMNLGASRPSGEMHYGTDASTGRLMPWDGSVRWPEVRLPAGMSPGTYWLALYASGREVSRGPRSLVVETCLTAVTEVAANIPAFEQGDDFEIVSARGVRSGAARIGPYELRVVVRNNGTSARRYLVAPAYVDDGVVKVGERGFMRGGETMALALTLDVREDALVLGGSAFSTKVFLVDPEATGGYDRQLFRDSNMANHIREVAFTVKPDTYTVTVTVTSITVHHGCDDIEDLKPWFASLYPSSSLDLQCQPFSNGVWGSVRPPGRREGEYWSAGLNLGSRPFDVGTRRTSSPAIRCFNVRPGTALPFTFQVLDLDPNSPDDFPAVQGFAFSSDQWQRGHTYTFSPAATPSGDRGCPPGTVSFSVQASPVSDRTGR